VPDLDAALATACARGGRPAHEPFVTSGPPGGRVVYLEDPQGAAIGLRGP
jgi:predicted enzyme related to lactoylglutathione lyase